MTNQLPFKHKNSLPSREQKMSQENGSKNLYLRPWDLRVSISVVILCCTFLVFWFIICPLTWAICFSSSISRHWFKLWPTAFWVVAFAIWVFITILFLIIWKCIKHKRNMNIKKKSYGSDGTNTSIHLMTEGTKLMIAEDKNNDKVIDLNLSTKDMQNNTKQSINNSKVPGDIRQEEPKKRNELPPLVIHKTMSPNNIENINKITTDQLQQKGDDKQLIDEDIEKPNVNRNSIKDYLKLVTVTPSDEEKNIVSPRTPMSPRDLFFIDMIKGAEKAGKMEHDTKTHTRFFPNTPITPSMDSTDRKTNNSDDNDSKSENLNDKDNNKNDLDNKDEAASGLNYFIADVESPKTEKAEVFIEIDTTTEPDKKETLNLCSVHLNKGKPVLILESESAKKDYPNKDTNMSNIE